MGAWSITSYEVPVPDAPFALMQALRDVKPERTEVVTPSDDPLREIAPRQYVLDLAGLVVGSDGKVACPGHARLATVIARLRWSNW